MKFLPKHTLIIAEIGSNHDGDLNKAIEMIKVASDCGVDVVKFQSFLADDMYPKNSEGYRVLKPLEIPKVWYPVIIDACRRYGVRFLSTATNMTTVEWMEEEGVEWYKIASGNITHKPLIDRLAEIGKPIIVSTGLATLDEIISLSNYFNEKKLENYAFLHCISKYPPLPEENKLKNIQALGKILSCPIGFSDHSLDSHMSLAAVALGARIIEKHITLTGKGLSPDHEFSLKPNEFSKMVRKIRDVEKALFEDFSPNTEGIFSFRRSLHADILIKSGSKISRENIKITRPEDGLSPSMYEDIIGCVAKRDINKNSPILKNDLYL